MAFLSSSARLHLRALTRSADRISIPQIPSTHSRSIFAGRPRPSFPPARPNIEHTPPPPKRDNTRPRPQLPRRPTNRQIPFAHVYLLDPDTNKLSHAPRSLEDLLAAHPRRVLELVASAPKPIVRVTTRSEVEARYREMKRALKKGARVGEEPKEVQLTWGVARADLEHKLRKAGRDLDKGYRVVVAVTMKRRHRPSNREELVAFADEISDMLGGVGEEWKEREITDRLMVLSFRKAEVTENVP
ncbi:hypothetical protein OG21DRAFT_1483230 [Imleria badia]|nr:hypothetical protein OG21DRAFT_1483230 [Imleria badia]